MISSLNLLLLLFPLVSCASLVPAIHIPPERLKNVEKILQFDGECRKTENEVDKTGMLHIKEDQAMECPSGLLHSFTSKEMSRLESYIQYLYGRSK